MTDLKSCFQDLGRFGDRGRRVADYLLARMQRFEMESILEFVTKGSKGLQMSSS